MIPSNGKNNIWQKRNDCVFKNNNFSPHAVVICTASYHCNFPRYSNVTPSLIPSPNIKWNPPPSGSITINFDGSVLQQNSVVAAGFILRDDSDCHVLAFAHKIGKTTVPIAKATALRDNLLTALDLGFHNLLFEGDSYIVINCVNGKFKCPWRLIQLIQVIRSLASSIHSISFQHVFREANFAANELVNFGHQLSSPCHWDSSFPPILRQTINFDIFGAGCSRCSVL
ncbi:hypothetical protein ACLB2K_024125 [Fragaria x ananassa]